ncbi:MAG TPA: TraB/GumN family protein [Alphaproteobacteria bacterium]|nr:TraB/GumN family protein [Alphaproteobacteria bacterium]
MYTRSNRWLRRIFGIAIAFVVLAAILWELFEPGPPTPAMWMVRDSDSTIYLFGTIHLTPPGTTWRTGRIAQAFDESGEVWLEAVDLADPKVAAAMQAVVLKHGFDRAHPLSGKLSPEVHERVVEAARDAGLPPAALETMRPWLAALALSMGPLIKDGHDAKKGVDLVLEADARQSRKVVKGFETAEQQVMFFANLSPEVERAFLEQTVRGAKSLRECFEQLADAWEHGDVEALDKLINGSIRTETPELYDTLIARRNAAWSDKIAGMMQGSGTIFIAVGVGHLVGEQGLPALLAARGFEVHPD